MGYGLKRLIVDLDDTFSFNKNGDYATASLNTDIVTKLREYKLLGFSIVINTARNMRTYEGNIGKINANTMPVIIKWLDDNNVPYDEIYTGKPWCGHEGFYVDDKSVRPAEFVRHTYDELLAIIKRDTLEPDA